MTVEEETKTEEKKEEETKTEEKKEESN